MEMSRSFEKRTESLVSEKCGDDQFSGVVSLYGDGQQLFGLACGLANRTWKIPNRLDTRFRIASLSKIFTAVSILQLVEQRLIGLDDGVTGLLGLEDTKLPEDVTIYHLLTMTAGIADWFDESGDWEKEWDTLIRKYPIYLFRENEDYLPLFINQDPIDKVGFRHHYNGASYILLGLIIEEVTRQSYFDAIRQNIFARAGMSQSDFLALDFVDDNVAEGYIPLKDENDKIVGWKRNIYSTTPEAAADGGATSTAADLVRFAKALRDGVLLTPEMTSKMLTPAVLQFPDKHRGYTWKYGLGLMFLVNDLNQVVRYGHTGEEDGVSCRLYNYPRLNLDLVLLGNQSWCAGKLAWDIHDLIISDWSE